MITANSALPAADKKRELARDGRGKRRRTRQPGRLSPRLRPSGQPSVLEMACVQVLRNPAVSAAASRAGVCCVSIIDHEGKRLVATGSSDGQIMVVDGAPRPASRMRNKRRPKTAATARTRFFKGIHRKTITGIAFHRGSDLVVVSCSNDSTCEVYDVFDVDGKRPPFNPMAGAEMDALIGGNRGIIFRPPRPATAKL